MILIAKVGKEGEKQNPSTISKQARGLPQDSVHSLGDDVLPTKPLKPLDSCTLSVWCGSLNYSDQVGFAN